ncbi:hypothetical protein BSPWISOXPB_5242, partial [uncultured Gammaproteobacteria bacterium]
MYLYQFDRVVLPTLKWRLSLDGFVFCISSIINLARLVICLSSVSLIISKNYKNGTESNTRIGLEKMILIVRCLFAS